MGVKRRVEHIREICVFGLFAERDRKFTKLWIIKESYVQYIGTELMTLLRLTLVIKAK